jgi:hypothetical protein
MGGRRSRVGRRGGKEGEVCKTYLLLISGVKNSLECLKDYELLPLISHYQNPKNQREEPFLTLLFDN